MDVTVGVLGVGRHATQSHILPLVGVPGVHVLLWDPDTRTTDGYARRHVAKSERELVERSDGVVVCSPDRFHTPTMVEVLEAGKHVLVEKPLAVGETDLAAVRDVLHNPVTSGRVSTCHPRRCDPPFVALRNDLPSLVEQHGPVTEFRFVFTYPPPRPDQPILHTSLLTDHFGHEFDLVEFYFGVSRTRIVRTTPSRCDHQLYYSCEGDRADGVKFSFQGDRHSLTTEYKEAVTVRFADGNYLVCNTNNGEVKGPARVTTQYPPMNYQERFDKVNRNFVGMIRGEAECYVPAVNVWRNTHSTVMLQEHGAVALDDNL